MRMYNLLQTGLLGISTATSLGSQVSAEVGHSQRQLPSLESHLGARLGFTHRGWNLRKLRDGGLQKGCTGGTRPHQREVKNNEPVHIALIY